MKYKRSERLVDITALLINHPHQLFSLNDFTEKYKAGKSSISEDISIIKDMFLSQDIGLITSYAGAAGGVKFSPCISKEKQVAYADEIIDRIEDDRRILPGGYLYITDLLGDPSQLRHMASIMASQHVNEDIDYILTVAMKGITLAQALAQLLNVPVVIARQDTKVTEGATVSVKYTSQSAPRLVQSMEVGRDSIRPKSKLILVDDFLRGEGTMNGMQSLVEIFDSQVIAKYVLCENVDSSKQKNSDVKSIVAVTGLDESSQAFRIKRGSLFDE